MGCAWQAAARAFMEKTEATEASSADRPKSSALATGAPTQYWFAEVDKVLNSEVDGDEELEILYEFAQQQSRNDKAARALVATATATATGSERPWEEVGKNGGPFLDKKARQEQSRRLNERIERIQQELKQQKDQEQRAKVRTVVQSPAYTSPGLSPRLVLVDETGRGFVSSVSRPRSRGSLQAAHSACSFSSSVPATSRASALPLGSPPRPSLTRRGWDVRRSRRRR